MSAAGANHCIDTIVGKVRVSVEFFGIYRESGRNGPVSGEEASCCLRQRKLPCAVRTAKPQRDLPDSLLVGYQILQERYSKGVLIFDDRFIRVLRLVQFW